tara:strand:+ start:3873 stop:4085 length:213 start_codon:yes stop_codon:yes gene_type:complete
MEFKPGELVYIKKLTGEPRGIPKRLGIVVRKSYQAYNEKYSRYDVYWLAKGNTITFTSHSIIRVKDADHS